MMSKTDPLIVGLAEAKATTSPLKLVTLAGWDGVVAASVVTAATGVAVAVAALLVAVVAAALVVTLLVVVEAALVVALLAVAGLAVAVVWMPEAVGAAAVGVLSVGTAAVGVLAVEAAVVGAAVVEAAVVEVAVACPSATPAGAVAAKTLWSGRIISVRRKATTALKKIRPALCCVFILTSLSVSGAACLLFLHINIFRA